MTKRYRAYFGLLLLVTSMQISPVLVSSVQAEERQTDYKTLLEIGVGVSVVDIPHYAGSEQSKAYALPFPFFNYQSKKVSLNRDGLKRYLLKGENWDLDLSFAGSIPIDSDDNRARRGMPDLDWVGLAGPAFKYHLYRKGAHRVRIEVPLRLGLATDFSDFDYVGWDFAPKIQWRTKWFSQQAEWNSVASFGLEYADSKYNGYYYDVVARYATADRPEYSSAAGYGGYKLTLGINRRKERLWMGAFVRYRNLGDASFVDSPLVTTDENYYLGLAVAWIIKSDKF